MTITIKSISRVLMITVLLAVAALMMGAVYTYRLMPPVPDRVVATDGTIVYTGADIAAGKKVFQRRSLMDYGTLLGNGGYFGPDFTAEYLEWMIALMQDRYAREQFGRPFTNLPAPEQAAITSRVGYEWKHSAYRSGAVTVSPVYAAAHREI
ncbi:MAG TPA: hypothetical protein VEW91_10945, partial [bacterium]|nr:hypothetical protein [bacterium]